MMRLKYLMTCAAVGLPFGASACAAQTAPTPLSTPAIAGPLHAATPTTFDAGPLGKLELNGAISGLGLWQGNPVPGDESTHAVLSSGQVFVQRTEGWWQFYLWAGAYDIPVLGTQFFATDETLTAFYGPVPVDAATPNLEAIDSALATRVLQRAVRRFDIPREGDAASEPTTPKRPGSVFAAADLTTAVERWRDARFVHPVWPTLIV